MREPRDPNEHNLAALSSLRRAASFQLFLCLMTRKSQRKTSVHEPYSCKDARMFGTCFSFVLREFVDICGLSLW